MHVRLLLGHAAVQVIAERVGAELVHLKGLAIDADLLWPGRGTSDVDVLVRPRHARRMAKALVEAGWRLQTGYEENSSFAHAATYWHDMFGYVDLHRYYPGMHPDAEVAFAGLLRHCRARELGGVECLVPERVAQRLVLLLHAGRGRSSKDVRDVEHVWHAATDAERAEVEALAQELGADLGLAAATGRLDEFRADPRYRLWAVASRGGTRFEEWRARLEAAPSRWDAVVTALRAVLVNTQHLEAVWGRPPTRAEVVREFFARPVRGLREEVARWRARRSR